MSFVCESVVGGDARISISYENEMNNGCDKSTRTHTQTYIFLHYYNSIYVLHTYVQMWSKRKTHEWKRKKNRERERKMKTYAARTQAQSSYYRRANE